MNTESSTNPPPAVYGLVGGAAVGLVLTIGIALGVVLSDEDGVSAECVMASGLLENLPPEPDAATKATVADLGAWYNDNCR